MGVLKVSGGHSSPQAIYVCLGNSVSAFSWWSLIAPPRGWAASGKSKSNGAMARRWIGAQLAGP
jgi:uncharacterized protein YbdZ (MbtH family)